MRIQIDDKTFIEVLDNSNINLEERESRGEMFAAGDALGSPSKCGQDDKSRKTIKKAEEALEPIVKFAEVALECLKKGTNPSELEITFGAEAGGEGGFFGLAKAQAKATMSVKLKWVPESGN